MTFPTNWYWTVAANNPATHVYSSAAGFYVAIDDPAYVAWRAAGNVPTKIETEEGLGAVLAPHFLRPTLPVILDAYKEAQAATYTPVDVTPKVIHFIYNEVRELQGLTPLTFAQFRQAIKDRM